MITAIMFQQEARREEERKLEAERRREQERKWQEVERQKKEQHLMTMSIISKALLPGMPSVASHPDKEVVHSEPSTSKKPGQFICYSENIKPDSIQLKYNCWDPTEYLYNTSNDHQGLDESSILESKDKFNESVNNTTLGPHFSSIEKSSSDSDSFDYDEWVSEQLSNAEKLKLHMALKQNMTSI